MSNHYLPVQNQRMKNVNFLMKKWGLLLLLLIISFISTYSQTVHKKVAVFDPTGIKDPSVVDISRETIINSLVNSGSFTVLEREKIKQVLRENKYQEGGNVDDSQVSELGRQMGADIVCITTVRRTEGNKYFVSVHIVDVTTAQTLSSGIGVVEDVYTAADKAAGNMIRKWTVENKIVSKPKESPSSLSVPSGQQANIPSKALNVSYMYTNDVDPATQKMIVKSISSLPLHYIAGAPSGTSKAALSVWSNESKCDIVLLFNEEGIGPGGIGGTRIIIEFLPASAKARLYKIKKSNIVISMDNADDMAKNIAQEIAAKTSMF